MSIKRPVASLLIVLVVLAALWAWLRHRDALYEVIPGEVYRSAQLSGSELRKAIAEHGIRSVINLRPPVPDADWYREEKEVTTESGVGHYDNGMLQEAPAYDRVVDLYHLLQDVERPVLVHCLSGVDRSGLAGVMSLLIAGEQDLDRVAEQVSWRYGAIREDSVGKPFLEQYRAWLASQGNEHSPELFERWLQQDYVDPTGNVHFLVHPIGGKYWLKPLGGYEEGTRFELRRAEYERLELDGWALDSKVRGPLADVEVMLDGQPMASSDYGRSTDWLVDDFGSDAYAQVGWAASQTMSEIADGCHDLSFRFERLDGSQWKSPPAGRICIE